MITPVNANFGIVRGTTANWTITLVSGSNSPGAIPIDLTGFESQLVVGPFINLSSTNLTVSGGLVVGGTTGVIQVVMSGVATNLYSPQQYYVSLLAPNGNYQILMNGSINFISPFNRAIAAPRGNYIIGSPQDVIIGVDGFDDLTPIAVPPPITTCSGVISWGNIDNG